MIAETTIRKIGNSKGMLIPGDICDELGLSVGQRVRVETDGAMFRVRPERGRTLRDRLVEWDGERYRSQEIDWGKPVGNEIW